VSPSPKGALREIIAAVVSAIQVPVEDTLRRIRRVQILTLTWMSVEAIVSLWTASIARSPALAAFGGDSAIEFLSAAVVLWRFRSLASERAEKRAARITGVLLLLLAACVVLTSALSLLGYSEPKPSYIGMAVLVLAATLMPWLAKEKRRLSAITASAALRADAAESALCAYLAVIALAGLAVNSIWHVGWADPMAALALVPLILFEAREAMSGKPCNCS
jgi:divalent metal cation (Fe/Co/Zn/Cd) transporter